MLLKKKLDMEKTLHMYQLSLLLSFNLKSVKILWIKAKNILYLEFEKYSEFDRIQNCLGIKASPKIIRPQHSPKTTYQWLRKTEVREWFPVPGSIGFASRCCKQLWKREMLSQNQWPERKKGNIWVSIINCSRDQEKFLRSLEQFV